MKVVDWSDGKGFDILLMDGRSIQVMRCAKFLLARTLDPHGNYTDRGLPKQLHRSMDAMAIVMEFDQ